MGARGMAMEAARPAPEALEAEPKEAPIPDAVKKLYDEIGDKSFINMVSSPLNRDRFRKREAEYVLNRLDKIANAPKPQRPDLARRARLIADDIRTDFEIPFPEEKEPAMKYPEVAPLSNDEVQRRLAAVAEEINTEDVLPERVEELRA
jgi:hypothetical protein